MSDNNQKNNHSIEKMTGDLDVTNSSRFIQTVRQNDELLDKVINARTSFLQQFIPDPRKRTVIMEELKAVKDEFEFRRRVLSMTRETQIQALQEVCNQYLVKGKSAIRADTGSFLLAKAAELEAEVNRIFDEFTSDIEKRWKKAEAIQIPQIKKTRLEQLEKDYTRFAKLQEELLNKFLHIVSEGV